MDAALSDFAAARLEGQTQALVRIELAMSLVLRGRAAAALPVLTKLARSTALSDAGYLAAAYLAETGDPSAFPTMLATLHGAYNRGMAARHLLAFQPWDGKVVAGGRVDLRALLIERLRDQDPLVRREIPVYLEELGAADLRGVLEPIARSDGDEAVRASAQAVLDRLAKPHPRE